MFSIALICEGPTDRAILTAILDHYFDDYELASIQPPITATGGDSGPFGGGWKGVRTWCQQEASSPACFASIIDNHDLLVIQLDADVSTEEELDCHRPCPPPAEGSHEVRNLIGHWIGSNSLEKTILCIPSMASETWAMVALFPQDPSITPCHPPPADKDCIECRTDIKVLLKKLGKNLKPKLVVSQKGKLKNLANSYKAHEHNITNGWPQVLRQCSQAKRFDLELRAFIS